MQAKIGSRYILRPNIKGSRDIPVTLVHVFPAGDKPDETLIRVYTAGPAGEPPPENVYDIRDRDRWVLKTDSRFLVVGMPLMFHSIEEVQP